MAIFECKYIIGLSDVGMSNKITNKAILKILENAGGMHSESVGYGLNKIEQTRLSWVLLNWKVEVIKRPIYNEEIKILTWARDTNKIATYRDFELYNSQGEKIIKATSKWTLINIDTKALEPIPEDIMSRYNPEEKTVFESKLIPKLKEPSKYDSYGEYKISRNVIDINEHVHNLYYLDFAYEVLPEEVYKSDECNNIEVMYKKQIKLKDKIKCLYSYENERNIITIKSKDDETLHAIINLY